MEHGDVNPNLETEFNETFSVADFQDEGGVDTNSIIAGPSGTTESKEFLPIELEINQNIETTKLKNNNDNVETLEFGNKNTTETIIQNKETGKNHYVCKFCFQSFNKHQALGGHMNGHSKDQRNLKKFEKVANWIQETYPPPLNTTLASKAELQSTPTNGVTYNGYNNLVEDGNAYNQLGGQWKNQQSTQQIQSSQGLRQQQLQYYQAQQPQHYEYSQGLQSNQVPKSSLNIQALQSPQNYQAPQRLQNYQIPQGIQNPQASQESKSHQTPQQFQNNQTFQELEYYPILQGSQNYQFPQGPQYHQAPQKFQHYQSLRRPQSNQTPQGSQIYQTPQGQWQQLVADAKNQQNINLNSNKPMSLAKVPFNVKNKNLSNSQGLRFQKEAQGSQRYMPIPHNLFDGDHLTTRPFINEHLNEEYNAQIGSNVLRRSNQMISTPHNYDIVAQCRPANPPNTSNSTIQSKDE